jgi:dihydropyrimidinase
MKVDLLVKNGKVVTPEGITGLSILVKGGTVVGLTTEDGAVQAGQVIDASGLHVLPGGVEPHTHLGLYLGFENDLVTETRSAAAGGITTVCHQAQTTGLYKDVLDGMIQEIENRACVDMGLVAIINNPNHLDEVEYLSDKGIKCFKYFMAYKGEEGKALKLFGCDEGTLLEGFTKMGKLGVLPMVHAECQGVYLRWQEKYRGQKELGAFSLGRPWEAEDLDIRTVCRIGELTETPFYIVHLAYGGGINIVEGFRRRGNIIYIETCPHYLTVDMSGERLKEPFAIKVMPPVRTREDIATLWTGLAGGAVQTIGTDHCPNMWENKRGDGKDIWTALAGFPGLATRLPLILSEGVNKGLIGLERAAEILSTNPAKLLGIYPKKGCIMPGSDADFVLVDLNLKRTVDAARLHSACNYSPWDGWELTGWPVKTIVRGEIIMDEGQILGNKGFGKYVRGTEIRHL